MSQYFQSAMYVQYCVGYMLIMPMDDVEFFDRLYNYNNVESTYYLCARSNSYISLEIYFVRPRNEINVSALRIAAYFTVE